MASSTALAGVRALAQPLKSSPATSARAAPAVKSRAARERRSYFQSTLTRVGHESWVMFKECKNKKTTPWFLRGAFRSTA